MGRGHHRAVRRRDDGLRDAVHSTDGLAGARAQHFNFDIDISDKKYDLAEFVSDNAVDATDVAGLIRKVEPDSDQYRATEAALAHYLDLAKMQAAAAAPALPEVSKPGLSPGDSYAAAGAS